MIINRRFLPIKAHYFFFMAAMGPILPQLTVFGKQLGISSEIMGSITGLLPIVFLIAKPTFGFIVDYFQNYRKCIFMILLMVTSTSYALFYVLPKPMEHAIPDSTYNFTINQDIRTCSTNELSIESQCTSHKNVNCSLNCTKEEYNMKSISLIMYLRNSSYGLCQVPNDMGSNVSTFMCISSQCSDCDVSCTPRNSDVDCLYGTITFWGFVVLLFIGSVGFNVANSISDAVCFDVLGENGQMKYGQQRVWGTIGFGLSALIAGYAVDWISNGDVKIYTPAFIIMMFFSILDVFSCFKLKLPKLPSSENILKDLGVLLKLKHIVVFLIFATLAGVLDSLIVFFLFWYLEDLAIITNYTHNIKLLEGLTVAAETLGGEVIFFSISGKILKRFGYGHTLTLCFCSYALRFLLISFIPNPWWVLPIEFVMQGPTYAMTYTTIVAYASVVSPPGTSATMQGIVAGMDDGFGYAIGSVVGGFLYKHAGGVIFLRIFSGLAILCALLHFILYVVLLHKTIPESTNTKKDTTYETPENAIKNTEVAVLNNI